jgi:predicted nucleic acid-binding protein
VTAFVIDSSALVASLTDAGSLGAWARATIDDAELAAPHLLLFETAWRLRQHTTIYDAAYVVLATVLDVPLLTLDRRLARAPGVTCEVLTPPA